MDAQKFNRLIKKIKYDPKAIESIYAEFHLTLKVHIQRRFGNLISPEDFTQDIFLKLLEMDTPKYIEYPTAWLNRLADNHIIDKLRGAHQDEKLLESTKSDKFDIEQAVIDNEVKEAMLNLDELTQKILYLHYWEGYSFKELEKELAVSYGSIRTRASRAYKTLKKYL